MLNRIVAVVKTCGDIVKNAKISAVQLKNEDRRNLVTEYDVKIQSILQKELQTILPEAAFLGEEGEWTYQKQGYCFVCDPIDGTTNFVKGYNFSAISVALLKNGVPVLGVVYNPFADELFVAQKGKGATLNGQPIRVTSDELANSLVVFGTGVAQAREIDIVFDYAKKCFQSGNDVRRSGSGALDLCNVACGRIGYFWELKLMPWDYAAGTLIVTEAGGMVKSARFENIADFFVAQVIFAIANDTILNQIPPLSV